MNKQIPSINVIPTRAGLLSYLDALPKAELHLHMEGCIRPEMLLQLAERNKLKLPFSSPEQCISLYNYRTFRDFSNVLLLGVSCLRTLQDFFDVVIDIGASMASQNIRYAEVAWTPQFYLNRGFPLDEILDSMNQARREAKVRWGIEMRWISGMVRSYPQPARLVSSWACNERTMSAGVVALGLGGPESGHPAGNFAAHFQRAKAMGLPSNPHAGEGMGPDSVWETINQLHPSRLGHGVRAIEDEDLVAHLARQNLPLEVCLTSNIRLGLYASYGDHPVKRLMDAGCTISLNTDDPVLFQTTLRDEYLHAINDCGLSLSDIRKVILDALRASYMSSEEKRVMLEEFQEEFLKLDCLVENTP